MEHALSPINNDDIDPDAAKVVRRLVRHGFEAYLVGGCVRDLLLGRTPKDFDVSTSATPQEIKKLFRNSRIIGRRFRLAHIFFGRKIIETSTFRAPPPPPEEEDAATEIIRRDNVFGTAEEDARRRDFTINGLFLDVVKQNEVIDHVGGLDDLRAHRVRTIGDPRVRLQEDPVRIIRAIKFAARLEIDIDPATEAAMVEFRGLIAQCSVARVLEEIYKLLSSGAAAPTFKLMHKTGVLPVLLPELEQILEPPESPLARAPIAPILNRAGTPREEPEPVAKPRDAGPEVPIATRAPAEEDLTWQEELAEIERLIRDLVGEEEEDRKLARRWCWSNLEALDRCVLQSPTAPPSRPVMLAALLMGPASRMLVRTDLPVGQAIHSLEQLVKAVAERLRISRKDKERLKQILTAQRRMVHRGRRTRPSALMRREYFPEAWQLFEMSCTATGDNLEELERWGQFQGLKKKQSRSRRRRRRPRGREKKPA
jgi:poly(A) polymerase